jgi:hypothetical protein
MWKGIFLIFLTSPLLAEGEISVNPRNLLKSTNTWTGSQNFSSATVKIGFKIENLLNKSVLGTDGDGKIIEGSASGGGISGTDFALHTNTADVKVDNLAISTAPIYSAINSTNAAFNVYSGTSDALHTKGLNYGTTTNALITKGLNFGTTTNALITTSLNFGATTGVTIEGFKTQNSTTDALIVKSLNFGTTTNSVISSTASGLAAEGGTVNTAGNPVSWNQLKNVPAGFADGIDDTGAGGGISVADFELHRSTADPKIENLSTSSGPIYASIVSTNAAFNVFSGTAAALDVKTLNFGTTTNLLITKALNFGTTTDLALAAIVSTANAFYVFSGTSDAQQTKFQNFTSTADSQMIAWQNFSATADARDVNFLTFESTSDAQQTKFVNFRSTMDATINSRLVGITSVTISSVTWPQFPDQPQIGPAFELLGSSETDAAISTITVQFSSRTWLYIVCFTSPTSGKTGGLTATFNGDRTANYIVWRDTGTNFKTSSVAATSMDFFGYGPSTGSAREIEIRMSGNNKIMGGAGSYRMASFDGIRSVGVSGFGGLMWGNSNTPVTSVSFGFIDQRNVGNGGTHKTGARVEVYGRGR